MFNVQVRVSEGQRVNVSLYTLSPTSSSVTGYCPVQAFVNDTRYSHTEPLCAVDNTRHVTTRHVFLSSGHVVDVHFIVNRRQSTERQRQTSFILELRGRQLYQLGFVAYLFIEIHKDTPHKRM